MVHHTSPKALLSQPATLLHIRTAQTQPAAQVYCSIKESGSLICSVGEDFPQLASAACHPAPQSGTAGGRDELRIRTVPSAPFFASEQFPRRPFPSVLFPSQQGKQSWCGPVPIASGKVIKGIEKKKNQQVTNSDNRIAEGSLTKLLDCFCLPGRKAALQWGKERGPLVLQVGL